MDFTIQRGLSSNNVAPTRANSGAATAAKATPASNKSGSREGLEDVKRMKSDITVKYSDVYQDDVDIVQQKIGEYLGRIFDFFKGVDPRKSERLYIRRLVNDGSSESEPFVKPFEDAQNRFFEMNGDRGATSCRDCAYFNHNHDRLFGTGYTSDGKPIYSKRTYNCWICKRPTHSLGWAGEFKYPHPKASSGTDYKVAMSCMECFIEFARLKDDDFNARLEDGDFNDSTTTHVQRVAEREMLLLEKLKLSLERNHQHLRESTKKVVHRIQIRLDELQRFIFKPVGGFRIKFKDRVEYNHEDLEEPGEDEQLADEDSSDNDEEEESDQDDEEDEEEEEDKSDDRMKQEREFYQMVDDDIREPQERPSTTSSALSSTKVLSYYQPKVHRFGVDRYEHERTYPTKSLGISQIVQVYQRVGLRIGGNYRLQLIIDTILRQANQNNFYYWMGREHLDKACPNSNKSFRDGYVISRFFKPWEVEPEPAVALFYFMNHYYPYYSKLLDFLKGFVVQHGERVIKDAKFRNHFIGYINYSSEKKVVVEEEEEEEEEESSEDEEESSEDDAEEEDSGEEEWQEEVGEEEVEVEIIE